MDWKRVVGKLLLVVAGTGCLVLVMFVLLPWLTAPPPPPQPMGAADILQEVLELPAATGDDRAEEEDVAAVPSPLPPVGEEAVPGPGPPVALRDNGQEVPVLFPVVEPGPGEGAAPEGGLPPVLTPEEVAAAMSDPEFPDVLPVQAAQAPDMTQEEERQPATAPAATSEPGVEMVPLPDTAEAPWPVSESQETPWQPDLMVAGGSHGSRLVEMTLPPPSATRQVQALLEALGYAPGPLDGIWGEQTAGAWRSFARDAAGLDARTRLVQARPEGPVVPALPERPAPVEGALAAEKHDGGQAGLPLQAGQEAAPVRVPGTLRGVMGYRLPLVSRQEVPDQVVSGVLIPAHTTFVILRGGEWELVGLAPDEVRRLKDAAEAAAAPPETEPPPVRRSWNPLRLFRRQAPHQGGR